MSEVIINIYSLESSTVQKNCDASYIGNLKYSCSHNKIVETKQVKFISIIHLI